MRPGRLLLGQRLDERRKELDLTWTEVARLAGLTYAGLRLIRSTTGDLQKDSKDGLDHALKWVPGEGVDAILDGRDPTPTQPEVQPRQPDAVPSDTPDGRQVVTLDAALNHIQATYALLGEVAGWQAMDLMNRAHNQYRVEPTRPRNTDRSA